MVITVKSWKNLFVFCLGLSIASGFCMKWMEADLLANGEKFTILGLELFYSKHRIDSLLPALNDPIKTILRYHLSFDFIFMAGVYPGISALCIIASQGLKRKAVKILLCIAYLQLLAWIADMFENYYLLKWINTTSTGDDFTFYRLLVLLKWIIVLNGLLFSLVFYLRRHRRTKY